METGYNIGKNSVIRGVNSKDFSILEKIMKFAIWEADIQNRRVYFSDGWYKILNSKILSNGYSFEEILKLVYCDDVKQIIGEFHRYTEDKSDEYKVQFRIKSKDGSYKCIQSYGLTQMNVDGKKFRMFGFITDITNEKKLQKKVDELTNIDVATGLKNLTYLERMLDLYIKEISLKAHEGALLFINIGEFKKINATYGFNIGSQVLNAFGKILSRCVRNGDIIARIGGDEFAILLIDSFEENDVVGIVKRIFKVIQKPIKVGEYEIYVSLSIGITNIKDNNYDAYEIIRRSHAASNRAKMLGENIYLFYEEEENEKFIQKISIENDLRHAIENEEFVLYYQPKVKAYTGELCGFEALIRWRHPTRGMVSPMEFILLAEESDLIIDIGSWVLKTACIQRKLWLKKGYKDFSVAINISAKQIYKSDFVKEVKNVLKETGLEAKYLEIEITESALINSMEATVKVVKELRNIGVNISLDDFGTGYSSLNYLRSLPIDKIKIDKSFIKDINKDEKVEAIIAAIIVLSKAMKLEIIAEGVENYSQLDYLIGQGCDQIQGYLFSRPETKEKVEEMLKKGKIETKRND